MGNNLSSVSPHAVQGARSGAANSNRSCPICRDTNEDADTAHLLPHLHQSCFGCKVPQVMWAASCPLCRSQTLTHLLSVQAGNDFIMLNNADEDQRGKQGAAGQGPRPLVDGILPEVWADYFSSHPNHIRPLLLWLRQDLMEIFEGELQKVMAWEHTLAIYLRTYGLHVRVLTQKLQPSLQEHAQPFVLRIITAAVLLCSSDIHQHLALEGAHTAGAQDNRTAASPSAPHLASLRSSAHSQVALLTSLPPGWGRDSLSMGTPWPTQDAMASSPMGSLRPTRKRRASRPMETPQPCKQPHLAARPSPCPCPCPCAAPASPRGNHHHPPGFLQLFCRSRVLVPIVHLLDVAGTSCLGDPGTPQCARLEPPLGCQQPCKRLHCHCHQQGGTTDFF